MIKCNSIAPKKEWKEYSPLEMELMGLFLGASNCSYYNPGSENPIWIITDHKPLEGMFGKPLSENTARILKLRLELMVYNLEVVWEAGKKPVCWHIVTEPWISGMEYLLPHPG